MALTLAMSPTLATQSIPLLTTLLVSRVQDQNVSIKTLPLSRWILLNCISIAVLILETGFYSKQGSECKSGMVFALNPSSTQSFSTFRQNALNTNSGSSGLSGGAKAGAAVGAIAGAALIFAALFYLYRRHRKSSVPVASPEDGTDNKPAMIGTSGGEWPAEHKPDVPPKGAELHDQSKPGELNAVDDPSELHDGSTYGTQNSPAEMWSPTSTMVSHGRQHSGFEQISPDER